MLGAPAGAFIGSAGFQSGVDSLKFFPILPLNSGCLGGSTIRFCLLASSSGEDCACICDGRFQKFVTCWLTIPARIITIMEKRYLGFMVTFMVRVDCFNKRLLSVMSLTVN